MKPVWIVLVNWNGWRDTFNCLTSLETLDYQSFQTLVVDNGSTDDSVARIRRAFPNVTIIEAGKNVGFAAGCNLGIKYALREGAEYVWLLNNDTTVESGALSALVERAEADPSVGAVGSAIYYASEPERLQAWGGGRVDFWLGRVHHFLRPVDATRIEYLSGASMLLRRSALESIGLLDEAFFMYWEDADYCFRLRRAGWRLDVAAQAKVWHNEQGSVGKKSILLDVYFNRSAARFFEKHAPFPIFSFRIGATLRVLKRVILGRWNNVHAVWSAARGGVTWK